MMSRPTTDYLWHEQSQGVWTRNIDHAERFFASFCRPDPTTAVTASIISGSASLSIPLTKSSRVPDALKQAWKHCRHDNPTLASWIEQESSTRRLKKVYQTVNEKQDLDEWLSTTFNVVSTDMSPTEWLSDEPPSHRLPSLFLLSPNLKVSEEQREYHVVLRIPHDILDGVGMLLLLDALMTWFLEYFEGKDAPHNLLDGSEVQNLSAPQATTILQNREPTEAQVKLHEQISTANTHARQGPPLLGLPVTNQTDTPARYQRTNLFASPQTSTNLLSACKQENYTLTQAIQASLILALSALNHNQPPAPIKRFTNHAMVNLRSALTSGQHADAATVCCAVSPRAMVVDVPATEPDETDPSILRSQFAVIAEQTRAYYTSLRPIRNDATNNLTSECAELSSLTWTAFTPPVHMHPLHVPLASGQTSADVSLSSLGRVSPIVKPTYSCIKVTDASVVAEPIGSGVAVFVWSWEDHMSLSAMYSSQWHRKEDMERLLRVILRCCCNGLGVLMKEETWNSETSYA